MRNPFIAGNWKMNFDHIEAAAFIKALSLKYHNEKEVNVAVFPPFTSILSVKNAIEDANLSISFGAQNMYFKENGAFTGEVSPIMLKNMGAEYVILGHSERREIFGESNKMINEKLQAAFQIGLKPILCVGESLEIRESLKAEEFVITQIVQCLKGITGAQIADLTIAYEPIWAIGTGKTATSEDADMMCRAIRKEIARAYGDDVGENIVIQYGGSVKPTNIKELMKMPNIDGALVGGASIVVEDFLSIINF